MAPLPFEKRLAYLVNADTLEPHQQPTTRQFKIATDFYAQFMLKHPALSEFHSRAEHLFAGLLEGDPTVTSYVPQPFMLRVGKRRYKPDCYVVTDNQPAPGNRAEAGWEDGREHGGSADALFCPARAAV